MKEEKEFDLWTGSTGGSNLQPVIWLVESFNTVTDRWIVQSTSKHFLEVPVLFQIVSCGFSPNGFVEQTIWHIRLAVVLNHDLNSIILEKVTALLHCILCNGLQPQLPRERGFPSLARTGADSCRVFLTWLPAFPHQFNTPPCPPIMTNLYPTDDKKTDYRCSLSPYHNTAFSQD